MTKIVNFLHHQFGAEESCYTRLFGDGSVERGCTLDSTGDGDPGWCKDIDDCYECKGHGCNNENIHFSHCLQCDSTDDEGCKNPTNETTPYVNVKCQPTHDDDDNAGDNVETTALYDPYPFAKRGCYTINKGIQQLNSPEFPYNPPDFTKF